MSFFLIFTAGLLAIIFGLLDFFIQTS